ncbi:uncharacterized protein CLUP02_01282 [Colletotrichum lupini]|uniref:Uncharacterized protein n=1 Tax=Colletotrichum lupini TaxID=145971 RepID=A0A9Q8W951_9PEZI|nr:uncharacterized protein CLUP02_01282 [Colletotrichum lupini]UQC74631.1 hypothetical protein CLUP02_01282 [Colletotrichum lupini]
MRSPYPKMVEREEDTKESALDQDKSTPHFDASMKTSPSGGGMLAIGLFGRPVNDISTWKPTEWLSSPWSFIVPTKDGEKAA